MCLNTPGSPRAQGYFSALFLSIILRRWKFLAVVTFWLRYPKSKCSVTSFKAPESAKLKIKFLNRVIYESVPREIS